MDNYPFSLIRVQLDPRRGEVVNIGIAVYLSDRLDARLLTNAHKLRALDPNYDTAHLANLDQWLAELDMMCAGQSAEQRRAFIEANAGVELGPIGGFRLANPNGYEDQVQDLLDDLVKPPAPLVMTRTRMSRLETHLRKDFTRRGVFSPDVDDIANHKIVPRYPISTDDNLIADFAVQNGALHVFAAIDFRGKPETLRREVHRTTGLKAITLDQAGKNNSARTFGIIAATEEGLDIAHHSVSLLNEYAERVFNVLVPEESDALMAHVMAATSTNLPKKVDRLT